MPGEEPAGRGPRTGRFRLGNTRVATRLVALILIPAVVAGILAGLRLRDGISDARVYGRIELLATFGERVAGLVQELQDERDLTVRYLTSSQNGQEEEIRQQQSVTDRAANEVRALLDDFGGEYSAATLAKVGDIRYRLDSLPGLRKLAGVGSKSAAATLDGYTVAISSLLELDDLIAQGSPDTGIAESTRAFAALARAKETASQERARIAMVLLNGRFATPDEREALLAVRSQHASQTSLFRSTATTGQQQLYEDTVTGPSIGQVEGIYQQVLVRSGNSKNLSVRPLRARDTGGWVEASTLRLDQMREVERSLAASITGDARALEDDAWTGAIIDAAVLLVGLLLAGLATVVVARSLVRPLRRLQSGALEIAGTRLPGLVDRLRDPEAAAEGIEVEPIDVESGDEIGRVARAFDEVHREAVRLAADEAVLRGNINAMFVNLSRRSQSLIERQLRLIEELEQSERDEDQLANLFRLDHLATRMRRNCENLLVLGGQDQVRRWNRPVPLIDVVRASLSEVEQYERVALRVQGDMTVAGPVVNDLVHLLAELVENATAFSAEHTKVTVSGQLLSGGGALLQITDNGVGMAADELEQANWRLANPPVIDFSAARRMGLFVVGRLAVRHGIRVELRGAQAGGLTAFVVLPEVAVRAAESGGVGTRNLAGQSDPVPMAPADHVALTTAPTPPALPGGVDPAGQTRLDDDYGIPRPRLSGTGPLPVSGGTGPQPAIRDADLGHGPPPGPAGQPGSSGPPGANGPQRGAFGHTGPLPRIGGTGPLPRVGDPGPPRGGDSDMTGPLPRVDPPSPYSDPGAPDLPTRMPGAQHPARSGGVPSNNGQAPPPPDPRDPRAGAGGPGRPYGTAPYDQQPYDSQPYDQQPYDSQPYDASPFDAHSQPPVEPGRDDPGPAGPAGADPHRLVDPSQPPFRETGPLPRIPWETGPLPEVDPAPAPERPAPERPAAERPAPQQPPPQRPGPPRAPERSPIFDAMRSEWFERRTDPTPSEDPVKGWESPGDAGFKAAEAAREPVAGQRTAAGLPKRVPGRNRVPGAVPSGNQGGPPRVPGTAETGQPAAPPEGSQGGQQPAPGQSADTVRSRFASLQRGVNRGRDEMRGAESGRAAESDKTGDDPSQGEGRTGGTR